MFLQNVLSFENNKKSKDIGKTPCLLTVAASTSATWANHKYSDQRKVFSNLITLKFFPYLSLSSLHWHYRVFQFCTCFSIAA